MSCAEDDAFASMIRPSSTSFSTGWRSRLRASTDAPRRPWWGFALARPSPTCSAPGSTGDFDIPRLPRLNLAIKRYDDDLSLLHSETPLTEAPEHATLDLTGQTILLVDDVIYEGHSMLRAIDYLARRNPVEIRTVVLVDRDVARLPVRTDVVGARLDVAPADIIECNVPPYEPQFRIDLCRQER
jgi:hypothetical protein